MKTVIFGIGNTLRSDDGVGFVAAERLSEELSDLSVEIIACHQLLPEHVEPLHEAQFAIFIDASVLTPPGGIQNQKISAKHVPPSSVSHHFDPQKLLELSLSLYGDCPEAELLSIGAENFTLGEDFSPPVAQALESLLKQIKDRLTE